MSTRSSVSSVTSAGLILADRTEGGWLPEGPAVGAAGVAVACEPAGVAGGSAVQLHRNGRTESTASTRRGLGWGCVSVISPVLYPHPPFPTSLNRPYKSLQYTIRLENGFVDLSQVKA